MAEPYAYSKFALNAVITTSSGDVTFDDIVSIAATFGLNSIPTAVMTVAVGYDARSNQTKKATIHDAKKKLRPRDKVVVTLTITPEAGETEKMESGTFVIFEGLLTGIGYQRATNGASYVLHLVHWLDELSNSSALNGNWFPNAPYDLAYNAACFALKREEGTVGGFDAPRADGGQPVPIIDSAGLIITKDNAEQDLWGLVIKPLFTGIASYLLPNDGLNTAAISALERIPGKAKSFATPLALDLGGLSTFNIQDSLRRALTKDALESFAYTSFWGKITGEYAAQFFFAVSPGVEHALAIPFFGGLKWEAGKGKEIAADEYSTANFNANMSQLLEAITVFWPSQASGMFELGGETGGVDEYSLPLGWWPRETIDGNDRPGLKLFKEPPGWIANLSSWTGGTGVATGIKGPSPGDTLSRGAADDSASPGWLKLAEGAREMQTSEVCERFAHHWYKTELLGQRYGELQGKLRFDIAPGSIVKIELPVKEIGSDGHMIAAVTSVSYMINAERALAGTSLVLGYIRTVEEDADDNISAPFAPLYKAGTAWHGGPLKTPEATETT